MSMLRTPRDANDPRGLAAAAPNKLAQRRALDRFGRRTTAERTVFTATKSGFQTVGAVNRQFSRKGSKGGGARVPAAKPTGLFDLTPTEDEQMLVDVVTEYATEVVRPAAADADEACEAPVDVLKAGNESGLPSLAVSEELGAI